MTSPIPLPDWLPWWVPILLLLPALLYGLMFLFMPFSLIGVKGRLDAIEARLDEIQGEIRSLALRMPEPLPRAHFDELYAPPPPDAAASRAEPVLSRPPIPPAPRDIEEDRPPNLRAGAPVRPVDSRNDPGRGPYRSDRTEPRLDWPQ